MTAGDVATEAGIDLRVIRDKLPDTDPFRVPVVGAPRWMQLAWRPWVKGSAGPSRIYLRPELLAEPAAAGTLVMHELVHVDQWRRHGRIGFMGRYAAGYLKGLFEHRSFTSAYLNVAFEVEARMIADEIMSATGPR